MMHPAADVRVYYISSFLPRRCGIATYTESLAQAVSGAGGGAFRIVALTDRPDGYDYPDAVELELRPHVGKDYRLAADYLNLSAVDVVSLQHEFNLFGGPGGEAVCELLWALRKPVVSTLHTVEREPSAAHRRALSRVCSLSDAVVVMNPLAVDLLTHTYEVSPDKIAVIHHGVPDVPFVDPAFYKDTFGLEGRFVVLTFGLLHPGKGIEVMIRALPQVVAQHPKLVYVVLGATHPVIRTQQGEAYRLKLQDLAAELGVSEHVVFVNRFVTNEELLHFLQAADVYVTPYLGLEQMTSGTLAYAIGMGKAVVSTPYPHAQALLADGRGMLVPAGDADALAATLVALLQNEAERHAMRKRAYQFARQMIWPQVGQEYLEVFRRAIEAHRRTPRPGPGRPRKLVDALPEVKLDHLLRLTDDTGLLRYSVWGIPDRRHGYRTEDAARGLLVTIAYHRMFRDTRSLDLARRYLAFLLHAASPEAGFRPHMTYDRRFEATASQTEWQDTTACCLMCLGACVADGPTPSMRAVAKRLFDAAHVLQPTTLLGEALSLLGMCLYLRRYPGATEVRRRANRLIEGLLARYETTARTGWRWFEEAVTHGFGALPEALIQASQVLREQRALTVGLEALDFLTAEMDQGDYLDLIGDQGWLTLKGDRALFAQRPADAASLVEAYRAAWEVTRESRYRDLAVKAFWWFLGKNRLRAEVYDFGTGACCDGLDHEGVNQNQGAESTLAFLLANLGLWRSLGGMTGDSEHRRFTPPRIAPLSQPRG